VKRIIVDTTKPRITMVSGIATMMMMVPVSSGFSARVPAPAAPILDWAHAVAMAGMPMASAAQNAIFFVIHRYLLLDNQLTVI
jgi:hypothetical protein